MKTKIQKFRNAILSLKGGIFAVLMLCTLQTFAQDAFYVYRNDGDFDGFFFDQVERMGYSKTDLEGVEQDVYVIQEIQTTDSLYRIPLANIDSIGFQQPDIIFNPRLKIMDDLGYAEYFSVSGVNGYGQHVIQFNSNLPESMIPQEGDILVGLDKEVFYTNDENMPCAGKVLEVKRLFGGDILCIVDELSDWGDIFEQFIAVEQIGLDQDGNVRHRIAGMNPDGTLKGAPHRKISGNFDVSLIDWSGRLQLDKTFWDKEFGSGSGSISVAGNVGIDVSVKVKARFVYQTKGIFNKSFFMKAVLSEDFSVGLSGNISFEGKREWDIDMWKKWTPKIYVPTTIPIFEIDPLPTGFLRVSGSASTQLSAGPITFGSSQTLILDSSQPWYKMLYMKWGDRDKQANGWNFANESSSWGHILNAGTSLNGYIQVGAKLKVGTETNSWVKKLASGFTGMEIYSGPKLEGNFNLDWGNTGDGWTNAYSRIKESNLSFSPVCIDREAKATFSVFGSAPHSYTFFNDSYKFANITWYLFPEFNKTVIKYNDRQDQLTATVFPRREVIKESLIGIGFFDENNKTVVASSWKPAPGYWFGNNFNEYTNTFNLRDVRAGKYKLCPLLKSFGGEFVVLESDAAQDVTVPAFVELKQREHNFTEGKGTIEIPLTSNTTSVKVDGNIGNSGWVPNKGDSYYDYDAEGGWFDADIIVHEDESRSLRVTVDNRSVFGHEGKVIVQGKENIAEYEFLQDRDTLTIYAPGYGTGIETLLFSVNATSTDNVSLSHGFGIGSGGNYALDELKCTTSRSGNIINVVGHADFSANMKKGESASMDVNLRFDVTHIENPRCIGGTIKESHVWPEEGHWKKYEKYDWTIGEVDCINPWYYSGEDNVVSGTYTVTRREPDDTFKTYVYEAVKAGSRVKLQIGPRERKAQE